MCCHCAVFSQPNEPWVAFWNTDNTLIGFKDKEGNVRIAPRFQGFTSAKRFEYIMAVNEEVQGTLKSYYLTKSGRKVGYDSLYVFDNTADCENEGFIRFRDKKTDKVGLFNRSGDMVVPAVYNELSRVRNGLLVALQGAKKKRRERGEFYGWSHGKVMLIDTNNRLLVDHFSNQRKLNFYSLIVSASPHPDTLRQNFKTQELQYCSFIDYEKEFQVWLQATLLKDFSTTDLLANAYEEIYYWNESEGWRKEAKGSFVRQNFDLLKSRLALLQRADTDYHIFDEGLNPFIYKSSDFQRYFNNCGDDNNGKYPLKSLVISYQNEHVQDHFEFLRTDRGYQLIGVSIGKGELR